MTCEGDGKRPICTRCRRSLLDCHWIKEYNISIPRTESQQPEITQPIHGLRQADYVTPEEPTSQNGSKPHSSIPYLIDDTAVPLMNQNYISTKSPEDALRSPDVARLFRHYIDNLASWYDLNDKKRHFEDIVPVRARKNALLLSAILAFAAANIHYSSSSDEDSLGRNMLDVADFYHLESVRKLIEITGNSENLQDSSVVEETLAAICLLRSYEIISRKSTRPQYLAWNPSSDIYRKR